MFDEELEKMKDDVYGKDDKKKLVKAAAIVVVTLVLILIFFLVKSKVDYNTNSDNLEKYAREYYNENMRTVNSASGYVVNLQMLESTKKYDLKYFEKCDKKDTNVDIYVNNAGEIISTKAHIKCK